MADLRKRGAVAPLLDPRSRGGRIAVGAVGVLGLLITLLTVLTSGDPADQGVPAPSGAPGAAAPVEAPIDPASISIPSIGAESTLIGLGRDDRGGWAVPDVRTPEQASWYSEGVVPGQPGPAVVLGHVNGGGRPGIFAKLGTLAVGAEVVVTGADGRAITFRVDRVQRISKADFPTDEVLADTADPQLRLITCDGRLRRLPDGTRSYDSSIIVYATRTTPIDVQPSG